MKRLEELVTEERDKSKESLIFVRYPTEENSEFGFLYQSGAYFVLNIVTDHSATFYVFILLIILNLYAIVFEKLTLFQHLWSTYCPCMEIWQFIWTQHIMCVTLQISHCLFWLSDPTAGFRYYYDLATDSFIKPTKGEINLIYSSVSLILFGSANEWNQNNYTIVNISASGCVALQ